VDNYKHDDPDTPLNEDPEENLRLANELLQMKLNAQFGAQSHSFSDLPPELENEFLKNVLAFETNYAEQTESGNPAETVYERAGNPTFVPANELDDEAVSEELGKVTEILEKAGIEVGYSCEYDDRTKYSFITEELFNHELAFSVCPA